MIATRAIILREVVQVLRAKFPNGHVTRNALLAETTRIGLSQPPPWLVSTRVRTGVYDLSPFFADADKESPVADRAEEDDVRTDADVLAFVRGKFDTLDQLARGVVASNFRALIISGPPGIGKTWGAEEILARAGWDQIAGKISGYSRATGLYRSLWLNRDPDKIIVIDDCDSVANDENALNLLKAACDTTKKRYLAWRAETDFEDEMGEDIPRHFEFLGRIIFITNLDLDSMSKSGGRLAPHLKAMVDRSLYLDLNLSRREILARVVEVAHSSKILAQHNQKEKDRIVTYVRENSERMREVSLRSLIKLSQILFATKSEADFVRISDATLLRRET